MAFVLRRPFAVSTAIKQFPKASSTARFFHSTPLKSTPNAFFNSKPAVPTSTLSKSRQIFQNAFRRNYMQQPYPVQQLGGGNLTQKLLYGAAIVGGTIVATNLIFNRETREDGGMPPYERSFLNETFLHTGLGVGIIGVAARGLHSSGWSYRLMAMNPWVVIGVSLAVSIGCMYGAFATAPEK